MYKVKGGDGLRGQMGYGDGVSVFGYFDFDAEVRFKNFECDGRVFKVGIEFTFVGITFVSECDVVKFRFKAVVEGVTTPNIFDFEIERWQRGMFLDMVDEFLFKGIDFAV